MVLISGYIDGTYPPGAPDCATVTAIAPNAVVDPCVTPGSIQLDLIQGTHWFFAGHDDYEGYPCPGGNYWVEASGVPWCPDPTTQVVTGIAQTTADLGWTEVGVATDWEIELIPAGDTPTGSGTVVTANPYTWGSLTDDTSYDWYVRSVCDTGFPGLSSGWIGPNKFTTLADCPIPTGLGVSNLLGTTVTLDWDAMPNATTYDWEIVPQGDPQGTNVVDSGNIGTNTVGVTGLTAETAYDFRVQTVCPDRANSGWSAPFSFTTLASCIEPSALTEANITTSGADLGWTQLGVTSSWNIEYGASSFVQGTGTMITGTLTNPYALGGLTENTTYDWYVQADCGGGDVSTWAGPSTFTTLCSVIASFPAVEDFENSGAIPDCWNSIPSADGDDWSYVTTMGFGANVDHTSGSGYFAAIDDSETPIANPDILLSPYYDTSGLTTPQLSFWYWIGNHVNSSTLYVDVWDGASWNDDVLTLTANGQWDPITLDITSYSSTSTQIRFRGEEYYTAYSYESDICLDDVTIMETPLCPPPTYLVESNVTDVSADLGWTENGSASAWNIEYGLTSFVQGTGTMITGTGDNPYPLAGLTSETTYDWYVQSDCGSTWAGPSSFTTTLAGIFWSEDCEDISDWTVVNDVLHDGADGWTNTNPGSNSLSGSTGAFLSCDSDANGSGTYTYSTITSPVIDCTGKTNVHLNFLHYFNYIGEYGTVHVIDGRADTPVVSYMWDTANSETADIYIGDIADGRNDIQIAFEYNDFGNWYWYWLIDDIVLYEGVLPNTPIQPVVTIVQDGVNATLSWPADADANSYIIGAGDTPTGPWTNQIVPTGEGWEDGTTYPLSAKQFFQVTSSTYPWIYVAPPPTASTALFINLQAKPKPVEIKSQNILRK